MFYIEADMAEPAIVQLPFGTAIVQTIACDLEVKPNQDSAGIIQVDSESALLIVADGMGGTRNGAAASAAVIEHLAARVGPEEKREDTQLRTAILDGIEAANQGGTTLAAVELNGDLLRPYHVGDSTILVTGQRGKLKLNTVAHSPVGFAVEAGLMDAQEAMHHHKRHVISNALGFPEMRIELGAHLELARHDTVIIASDGLTDNLFTDEIVEIARKGPLLDVVVALAKLARERMANRHLATPTKPDDLTIIAYRRDR
jgi:serine/threonine protein phosphatase PrpC